MINPVDEAILRTVLYADVFGFPMRDSEIHHFLIGFSAGFAEVRDALSQSAWLASHLEAVDGYWCIQGRTDLAEQRRRREAASQTLFPLARRCGAILAHLPFIRMVALTGALTMRNASSSNDDLDYMLVTTPGRVWLARAMAVLVVRIGRLWGVKICPNYVLAETALVQSRQDMFIAHELAQMIPLAGCAVYDSMRADNRWSAVLLPNADSPLNAEPDSSPRGVGRAVQWLAEAILSGPPGDALEAWEQRRKMRKFAPEADQPGSSAELDPEHVKGHFKDYGYPALASYRAKLASYALADVTAEPVTANVN